MNVTDAIMSRRTKRKYERKAVEHEKLVGLIECARFAPSAANIQPLKFMLIEEPDMVNRVFGYTKWSGYVPEEAPGEEEQPPAYIAMLGDKNIKQNGKFETDAGAAGTVIQLAAEEMGLSTCWLGAIERKEISGLLKLYDNLELLYLIAVGYSNQKSAVVEVKDNIKYYVDENGGLNVPKRDINDILINI